MHHPDFSSLYIGSQICNLTSCSMIRNLTSISNACQVVSCFNSDSAHSSQRCDSASNKCKSLYHNFNTSKSCFSTHSDKAYTQSCIPVSNSLQSHQSLQTNGTSSHSMSPFPLQRQNAFRAMFQLNIGPKSLVNKGQ